MIDLKDRSFWYRNIETDVARARSGLNAEDYLVYRLRGHEEEVIVHSMLSIQEIALLYGLARKHWSGQGAIIDAGPLMGASTFALSKGLRDNLSVPESAKHPAIYSFDLWSMEGYQNALAMYQGRVHTASLLYDFNRVVRQYQDYIVPHQGDFLSWRWSDAPIEIIFMDLAKSWELNTHYIKHFLPHLLPECGILIQQDYVHFNEYWVHITMEHFSEYFEFCDVLYGATAFFRLTRPIERQALEVDLSSLPFEQKWELLERARAKMPPAVQQVMKTAAAKCAVEHRQFDKAEAMLQDVSVEKLSDDPLHAFQGIARSNLTVVTRMLEQARAAA